MMSQPCEKHTHAHTRQNYICLLCSRNNLTHDDMQHLIMCSNNIYLSNKSGVYADSRDLFIVDRDTRKSQSTLYNVSSTLRHMPGWVPTRAIAMDHSSHETLVFLFLSLRIEQHLLMGKGGLCVDKMCVYARGCIYGRSGRRCTAIFFFFFSLRWRRFRCHKLRSAVCNAHSRTGSIYILFFVYISTSYHSYLY